MRFRPATARDARALAELSALLDYPTSAESLARRLSGLDPAENAVTAVEDGGRVVAWVHVFRSQRLEVDAFAELGGMIVAPSHRGRGLGRGLMEQAESWARANGCGRFRIRSHERRIDAHRFYERVGYQRIKKQQVLDKDLGRSEA